MNVYRCITTNTMKKYRISASSSTSHPLVLLCCLPPHPLLPLWLRLHHTCGFLWPLSWFLRCRADPSTMLLTFLYCQVVPHCAHGPQCNLFIHLLLEDHLGCFQFLTVFNKVTVDIHSHTGFYLSISFHFPWADDLGVGLLSMLSVLTSETAKLFSKMFVPEFAFLLTFALHPCQIIF